MIPRRRVSAPFPECFPWVKQIRGAAFPLCVEHWQRRGQRDTQRASSPLLADFLCFRATGAAPAVRLKTPERHQPGIKCCSHLLLLWIVVLTHSSPELRRLRAPPSYRHKQQHKCGACAAPSLFPTSPGAARGPRVTAGHRAGLRCIVGIVVQRDAWL